VPDLQQAIDGETIFAEFHNL